MKSRRVWIRRPCAPCWTWDTIVTSWWRSSPNVSTLQARDIWSYNMWNRKHGKINQGGYSHGSLGIQGSHGKKFDEKVREKHHCFVNVKENFSFPSCFCQRIRVINYSFCYTTHKLEFVENIISWGKVRGNKNLRIMATLSMILVNLLKMLQSDWLEKCKDTVITKVFDTWYMYVTIEKK